MLTYRVVFGSALALALSLVAVACGSDDSGSGGNSAPFSPAGNGIAMPEKEACEALKQARQQRRTELNCGAATEQPCPTFIQKGHEACSEYDQGTITGCAAFFASLPSCKELSNRECIVIALPGTAPNGCPIVDDGGVDAGEDAGEDASEDSPVVVDAGVDVGLDVELDVAIDVPLSD